MKEYTFLEFIELLKSRNSIYSYQYDPSADMWTIQYLNGDPVNQILSEDLIEFLENG